jgi:hypothetical protein
MTLGGVYLVFRILMVDPEADDISAGLGAVSHHSTLQGHVFWTEKFESRGKNMGLFCLTAECLKPPVLVSNWGERKMAMLERKSFVFGKKY